MPLVLQTLDSPDVSPPVASEWMRYVGEILPLPMNAAIVGFNIVMFVKYDIIYIYSFLKYTFSIFTHGKYTS